MHVPRVLELFVLLGESSVDVGLDGGDLELRLLHLGLLDLQRRFRLLQGRLQLLLLQLEATPRLVHLVHVAPALAQLVRQVVDLVCADIAVQFAIQPSTLSKR